MKKIDWRFLIITCLICLLPIILGIVYYNELPEQMAIHFNINNEPDNYASKGFTLFGIPVILTIIHIICCIITDMTIKTEVKKPKFIVIIKWLIPILSIVILTATIGFALEKIIDIRFIVLLVLGIFYILIGNYLPKMSYDDMKKMMHPAPKSEKAFRKLSRVLGYTFVIGGICILLSLLLEPIYSLIILVAFIAIILIETIVIR